MQAAGRKAAARYATYISVPHPLTTLLTKVTLGELDVPDTDVAGAADEGVVVDLVPAIDAGRQQSVIIATVAGVDQRVVIDR